MYITTGDDVTTTQYIFDTIYFHRLWIESGKLYWKLSRYPNINPNTPNPQITILPNTSYYIKSSFDGTNLYKCEISTDDETWQLNDSFESEEKYMNYCDINPIVGVHFNISTNEYDKPFLGSIDLSKCNLLKNNSNYPFTNIFNNWLCDCTINGTIYSDFDAFNFIKIDSSMIPDGSVYVLEGCVVAKNVGFNTVIDALSNYNTTVWSVAVTNAYIRSGMWCAYESTPDIDNGLHPYTQLNNVSEGDIIYYKSTLDIKNKKLTLKATNKTTGEEIEDSLSFSGMVLLNNAKICNSTLRLSKGDLKYSKLTVDGVEVFNGNKTGIDIIKEDDYTTVGSPTISNNRVYTITTNNISGGSRSNCVIRKQVTFPQLNKVTLEYEGITSNKGDSTLIAIMQDPQHNNNINDVYTMYSNAYGNIILRSHTDSLQDTSFVGVITPNIWFHAKAIIEANKKTLIITTRGETKTYVKEGISGLQYGSVLASIGSQWGGNYSWPVSTTYDKLINLSACKVYVDDQLIWQPCQRIPYTLTSDGNKIVDYKWKSVVEDVYKEKGYAPYIVHRPEIENFTRVGTPDIVNKIASGASNKEITKVIDFTKATERIDIYLTCKFNSTQIDAHQYICNLRWNGSDSSVNDFLIFKYANHVNDFTVNPIENATQRKLGYNPLGEWLNIHLIAKSNNTATIIIKRIETDEVYTATYPCEYFTHVKSDINGTTINLFRSSSQKQEVDLSEFKIYIDGKLVWTPYIKESYSLPQGNTYSLIDNLIDSKSVEISGLGMPSGRYDDLTINTEGDFIAPANGWFYIKRKTAALGEYVLLRNTSAQNIEQSQKPAEASDYVRAFIPANKGDIVYAKQNTTGTNDENIFKFIYAEGN